MKYSVVTFGCRVNQADSLGFEAELCAAGAVSTEVELADVVIVNTCSVTASADQGARQLIRRIARMNPRARIVATGCYATREPGELISLPNVNAVVPNDDKPRLLSFVDVAGLRKGDGDISERTTAVRFGQGEGSCGAAVEPGIAGRTAFTLRVQTGCDEPCSYCIIPSTRGAPRSVPIASVLDEVKRVRQAGFKEIALTGVHLGSYGRDLTPSRSLVELLQTLAAWAFEHRDVLFRISSLEPMDCSPEIVDLVAGCDCFAPHFHLPLQHASHRVLAAMRRPYTIEPYSVLVERIRRRIPHAAIGSDLIVGFPGETDEDADMLESYLEHSPITHVHVFPYSDRPGTAASSMSGKVHGGVIRGRSSRIREVGRRLSERFHRGQVGTVHRALTLEDGRLAVTGNYLKVAIPPGRARNEWIAVRVTGTGVTAEVC